MPSVLDQIEKALTEESALYPPMSSMARKEWSLARDRTEKLLRNHAADLIAVARAAQETREFGYDHGRGPLHEALTPLLTRDSDA